MKTYIPYSLILAAAATSMAFGAETAYTTPVGYITHTINPDAGGGSALTIVSPSLVQPTEFAGVSTDNPSGVATVSFSGGVPTTFNNSDVLEITSGANEGWWSTVVSSTTSTVTVLDNFPAGLAVGTKIAVRKHNTVLSTFGQNAPGLTPFGVGTPDEIQFFNPNQSLTSVVYATTAQGAPQNGWYFSNNFSSADSAVIEPATAVLVKSFQATAKTFQTSGTVKLTDTQVDIFPGLTLVGQPGAAGATIDNSGFPTQIIQFTGSNTNYDQLQFLNPSQSLTNYAALAPGVAGPTATMGNLGTGTPAGTDPFLEGTGAIIKRDPSVAASPITIQGSVVAP
ncbi:MAG: hypothetical protein V4584_05935 [Verrucomicrobiota bacterium]